MAERRMFAKTIVLSDAFLDMPMSARCLYFTLGMLADDDGFINSPRSIMRQCGASNDDMKILIEKKFVLLFDSGIIVIKHWRLNNYLRSDRYTETKYTSEKAEITTDDKGIYHREKVGIPVGIPAGIPSIGKDRLGKDSIDKSIKAPTLEEVKAYVAERKSKVDPVQFFEYYSAGNWKDGKGNPVKNWKQKLITWEKHEDTKVDRNAPVSGKFDTSGMKPFEFDG